jgi:hypothetical protein
VGPERAAKDHAFPDPEKPVDVPAKGRQAGREKASPRATLSTHAVSVTWACQSSEPTAEPSPRRQTAEGAPPSSQGGSAPPTAVPLRLRQ